MLSQLDEDLFSPDIGVRIGIRGFSRIAENINSHREQIAIAQQLATIVTDLPLIDSVSALNRQAISRQKVGLFCREMGFPALYKTIMSLLDN